MTERQSALMSEINNSGLDQYGKVYSLNGIGGERVNVVDRNAYRRSLYRAIHSVHSGKQKSTIKAISSDRTGHSCRRKTIILDHQSFRTVRDSKSISG